jgi:hypothetical protein
MVDDRRVLGDPEGILRTHREAELTDARVLDVRGPVGVEDRGARADLVPLGVEVMLDRRDAPEAELVGRLDELSHAVNGLLVALDIAPGRPHRRPLLLALSSDHGIELQDWLDHHVLRWI